MPFTGDRDEARLRVSSFTDICVGMYLHRVPQAAAKARTKKGRPKPPLLAQQRAYFVVVVDPLVVVEAPASFFMSPLAEVLALPEALAVAEAPAAPDLLALPEALVPRFEVLDVSAPALPEALLPVDAISWPSLLTSFTPSV